MNPANTLGLGLAKKKVFLPENQSIGNFPDYYQQKSDKYSNRSMTNLQHVCRMDIESKPSTVRHTNIICSIGPSTDKRENIRQLILNGMNIARLNMALGSFDYFANIIKMIREEEEKISFMPQIAVAIDISPPTIRTGLVNGDLDKTVKLATDSIVTFTLDDAHMNDCNEKVVWIDITFFPNLLKVLSVDDVLLLDDAVVELCITEIDAKKKFFKCLVKRGGVMQSHVRLNIPLPIMHKNAFLNMRQKILFALEHHADFVYLSFINSKKDILQVKETMQNLGTNLSIVPRIETKEGVRNIEEIMEVADGVIISRHELGLELSAEKVMIAQKKITALGLKHRKPTIIASQMLESMRNKPRPTRAEVSDVANAVIDGADALMLQVETSRGKYPVECLRLMNLIIREAEGSMYNERRFLELKSLVVHNNFDVLHTSSVAAVEASMKAGAQGIIVVTATGKSAQMISSLRPSCPVLAVTSRIHIARQCHIYRSLTPVFYSNPIVENWGIDIDNRINYAMEFGRDRSFWKTGDTVIVVTGWAIGSGATNTVRVFYVPEENTGGLFIERVTLSTYHD